MFINFGNVIEKNDLNVNQPDGILYQSFNQRLEQELKQLVFEISKNDMDTRQKLLEKKPSVGKKIILSLPAFIGLLAHWPVYLPIKKFTFNRTSRNDHYDSVLTGLLLFAYPLYLLVLTLLAYFFTKSLLSFLLFLFLPFTAWSYVQLKPQLDK